jgi:hypothetical protein
MPVPCLKTPFQRFLSEFACCACNLMLCSATCLLQFYINDFTFSSSINHFFFASLTHCSCFLFVQPYVCSCLSLLISATYILLKIIEGRSARTGLLWPTPYAVIHTLYSAFVSVVTFDFIVFCHRQTTISCDIKCLFLNIFSETIICSNCSVFSPVCFTNSSIILACYTSSFTCYLGLICTSVLTF